MHQTHLNKILLTASCSLLLFSTACSDDDADEGGSMSGGSASGGMAESGGMAASGGMASSGGTASSGGMASTGGSTSTMTLCEKYGGAETVESVIKEYVVPAIAMDCRINSFFTQLPEERLSRVADCLSIQAQELFACEGITYAGSQADNGLPCRSMAESHAGLGISDADFDALIEDVVMGMTEAGVESKDIQKAAPALLALEEPIVEESDTPLTMDECEDTDGGV